MATAKREANKKSSVRLLPQGKREAKKDQCLLEPVPFSFKNFSVSLTFLDLLLAECGPLIGHHWFFEFRATQTL